MEFGDFLLKMWDSHDILKAEYCMWNKSELLKSKDVFPYMFIL